MPKIPELPGAPPAWTPRQFTLSLVLDPLKQIIDCQFIRRIYALSRVMARSREPVLKSK